jgi:hypothetical protein
LDAVPDQRPIHGAQDADHGIQNRVEPPCRLEQVEDWREVDLERMGAKLEGNDIGRRETSSGTSYIRECRGDRLPSIGVSEDLPTTPSKHGE